MGPHIVQQRLVGELYLSANGSPQERSDFQDEERQAEQRLDTL